VHLLTRSRDSADIAVDSWAPMSKEQVATTLVARIADAVTSNKSTQSTKDQS
jgi:phosphopantothenoylcysteine decarboxylase/phosphopantothenate--cysteine ligase